MREIAERRGGELKTDWTEPLRGIPVARPFHRNTSIRGSPPAPPTPFPLNAKRYDCCPALRRSRKLIRLCSPKLTHTKNTTCPWARQFHPRRRRVSSCPRARFRISALEALQIRLQFVSRRPLASGRGARLPVRLWFCEQTHGSILPNKPGLIFESAEGLHRVHSHISGGRPFT